MRCKFRAIGILAYHQITVQEPQFFSYFFFPFLIGRLWGYWLPYQRRIRTSYDNFCGAFIGVSTVITYRSIESDTARETREIVASSISEIGRPSKKKGFCLMRLLLRVDLLTFADKKSFLIRFSYGSSVLLEMYSCHVFFFFVSSSLCSMPKCQSWRWCCCRVSWLLLFLPKCGPQGS